MGAGAGIALVLVSLLVAFSMEGGSPVAFLNPSAMLIVIGGTIGAAMGSYGLGEVKRIPSLMLLAMKGHKSQMGALRDRFLDYSKKSLAEQSLLKLESEVEQEPNRFLRRAMLMAISGRQPDAIANALEGEIDAMAARHMKGINIFSSMGGYAPTMGIIGTVMGLISVLSHLDDPSELGESIAVAFIATLIGVYTANGVWYPIASALRGRSQAELEEARFIVTGVLAVQALTVRSELQEQLDAAFAPRSQIALQPAGSTGQVRGTDETPT